MNLSEQFRRFAAECEAMAKFARSSESKTTWQGLAARWVLCAELTERQLSGSALHRLERRHRRSSSLNGYQRRSAEAA
jgi:hypothetical protein